MTAPAASGSLDPFELLALVEELGHDRFSGVLRMRVSGAEVRLFLIDGVPRYCMGSDVQHSLAAHLLRRRVFSKDALRPWLARARDSKQRLEEALSAAGAVDAKQLAALQLGLSHHVFGHVCFLGGITYRLDKGNPASAVGDMQLDPFRAFAMWLKDHDRTDHELVLHGKAGAAIRFGPRWEQRAFAFGQVFGEAMVQLVSALESGVSVGAPEAPARLLYGLECAGLVEFGATPPAAKAVPKALVAEPLPERKPSAALDRAREAAERARTSGIRVRPVEAIPKVDAPAPEPVDPPRPAATTRVAPVPATTSRVAPVTTLPTAGVPEAEVSGLAALLAREGLTSTPVAVPAGQSARGQAASGVRRGIPASSGVRSVTPRRNSGARTRPAATAPPSSPVSELPAMDLAGPEPEVIAVNAATPGGNKDLAAALANAVAAASADEQRKLDDRTADSPKVRRKQSAIRARPATSSESAMALATEAPAVEAAVLAGRLAPVAEGRTAPEEPALLPIFQFRSSLLSRDHFDILGVKPGAPLSTIHMARVALGERFDPTSYMGTYMPPEVRDDLDVINRALDLVAADLADEPRRRWLERQHGQMTDDELARYFRAHERFRAGRDLADQEKHTEAYDCFVEAVALNTLDPFYHLSCGRSQLAFARANKALTGEPLDRAMKHLKDALALDSGFERARVTLAEAYREIGRPQDAMEEYRQIVKNNPRNHDARRALRDLTAAVTQSANPEGVEGLKGKVGGLLGRLRRDK